MTKAKVGAQKLLILTDEEKMIFAKTLFEARKNDPEMGWKYSFMLAREALPEKRRIGRAIDHPTKLKWIQPLLQSLEAKELRINTKPEISSAAKKESQAVTKLHSKYSNEERLQFARYAYEIKKQFPNSTKAQLIQGASKMMPKGRQVGTHIDSMKQISWCIPLLEQLEKSNPSTALTPEIIAETTSVYNPRTNKSKLTEEQKEIFTKIVYESKKAGSTWIDAMRKANNAMPVENRIAESSANPSSVPWLKRNLDKLFADSRVIVNHTNLNQPPKSFPPPQTPAGMQYIPEGVKGHKTSQHKTYWNDEEKHLFAQYVYEIRITNLGMPWRQVMAEANALMPQHKQKSTVPHSASQIPWLPKLLDQISREPKDTRYNEPIIEMSPEPVVQEAPQPVVQAVTPPSNMNDMMITMMAAMFKQAMPAIMHDPEAQKKLQAAMLGTSEAAAVAPVQPVKQQPQAKKKVIVVGLLPVQANEVQKEFGRVFDMKFVGTNVPSQQIRDSAKNADIAICMTKFVSHSTQNTLRGHAGFNFCNGNTTALRIMLQEKLDRMAGQ